MSQKYPYLLVETYEEYRSKRPAYLSSHALADFRKSPILYKRKKDGLIPDTDRPSFALGRAAHTLLLEGREVFDDAYAVGGPINEKTGRPYGSETRVFAEYATMIGKPIISQDDATSLIRMFGAVKNHGAALHLIRRDEGQSEGVYRNWYNNYASQIRIDRYNEETGIVDLKTCRDLDCFDADARMYGYGHQLAFYKKVLGRDVPCSLIAVEKQEPYRCGVWHISAEYLEHCTIENDAAIERLYRCKLEDVRPTNYEDVRSL